MGERYADKFLADVYNISSNVDIKDNSIPAINTANGMLQISNIKTNTSLQLYDVVGKLIKQLKLNANETSEFSISKGVYLLAFADQNRSKTLKISVQ